MGDYNAQFTSDPRTNHFFLVSTPIPVMSIMFLYHRFVKSWGPAFMANRPAYDLKRLLILYNIIQILLSGLLAFEVNFLFLKLTLINAMIFQNVSIHIVPHT